MTSNDKKNLQILNEKISNLEKVSAKEANILENLVKGTKLIHLLYHSPSNIVDRSYFTELGKEILLGKINTVKALVVKHIAPPFKTRIPYRIILICADDVEITVSYFKANSTYLLSKFPVDEEVIVSGVYNLYKDNITINHPDYIEKIQDKVPQYEVVYPIRTGIRQDKLSYLITSVLQKNIEFAEWIDKSIMHKFNFSSWYQSLVNLHKPKSMQDIGEDSIYRKRLAFDEMLYYQIRLQICKHKTKTTSGHSIRGKGDLRRKLLAKLPYKLTNEQNRVLNILYQDQAKKHRMYRLLQGDVGCGKTIVALLAALNVVETEKQVAIMVPTAVLAMQQFDIVSQLVSDLDVKVTLLIGRDKKKLHESKLTDLKYGTTNIVVGTHALFQEKVEFHNLAFVIIDEQHKFGVKQREMLIDKGNNIDVLMLSATPIPRSLGLTIYGDLDISRIMSKPQERQDIITVLKPIEKIDEVVEGLKRVLSKGERAYWVCPLIEENEKSTLGSAKVRYDNLKKIFGENKIGLIHGKQKDEEKKKILNDFVEGNIQLLIATTVIEVGVNVPEATIIVIEQAQTFGLAQLHQLRGRVGRGSNKSYCVLIYNNTEATDVTKQRLQVLRKSQDGFFIAEADLKHRGTGDLIGVKQTGLPNFVFFNFLWDIDIIDACLKQSKLEIQRNLKEIEEEKETKMDSLLKLFSIYNNTQENQNEDDNNDKK